MHVDGADPGVTSRAPTVAVVSDGPLPEPAEYGLQKLAAALERRGWHAARTAALSGAEVAAAFVAVLPDSDRRLQRYCVGECRQASAAAWARE